MSSAVQPKPVAIPGDASPPNRFDLWAPIYDSELNPVLALEQRYLSAVLPTVRGLDIVDVGCGTGRWLERLAAQGAKSLTGIDSSPAMVDRARDKLGQSAAILLGDAASLPIASQSADLVLASFVSSHVQDLPEFAREIQRVARDGASIFLSDLHPTTAEKYNWKRGFESADGDVEFVTYSRSVRVLSSCFEALGFGMVLLLEPPFESPEQETFRLAGRASAFQATVNQPAIYVLQLKKGKEPRRLLVPAGGVHSEMRLAGARIAFGPEESAQAEITIANREIASIGYSNHASGTAPRLGTLDLNGYLVFPGLTNSHDHLEFGLYPNLGHGPYDNFGQWADDIHRTATDVINRQRQIPKDVRLWWGAIRNLLCGVTTVCHHNPFESVFYDDCFPIQLVSKFGWAHSVAMEPDLVRKFRDTSPNRPFILHAAEGIDENNAREVFELDRMGVLSERTVLVHGLGLTADGIELVNRRGATVVWCPTSNQFLFGRTHDREALDALDKLLLGSDSSLTAAGDLLDEVREAHANINVDACELYRMVITRPPLIFDLDDGRGTLKPAASADLIAVHDSGASPAETLAQISCKDVELVVVMGRVQLASDRLFRRMPEAMSSGLQLLEFDGQLRWIRSPLGRLFGEAHKVLGRNLTLGNKEVRYAGAEWF